MIELYSQNIATTATAAPVNFATKVVQRGRRVTTTVGGNTIRLNEAGLYKVTVSATVTASGNGTVTVQLIGNNATIARGYAGNAVASGAVVNVAFSTYVVVNNTLNPTDTATLQLNVGGVAGTIDLVDIIVE